MSPKPANCTRKQSLADDLLKATAYLIELDNQDAKAVIAADWEHSRNLGREIQEARKLRDTAREVYQQHVTEHGC